MSESPTPPPPLALSDEELLNLNWLLNRANYNLQLNVQVGVQSIAVRILEPNGSTDIGIGSISIVATNEGLESLSSSITTAVISEIQDEENRDAAATAGTV